MRAGYRIDNGELSIHYGAILVSDYDSLNLVVNLPCIKTSQLLRMSYDYSNVGVWKIKEPKQK